MRNFLGFNERLLVSIRNASNNNVDILPTSNLFIDCNIINGMIIKGDNSGIIHFWIFNVNPGCLYVEKFRGRVIWHHLIQTRQIKSMIFKLVDKDKKLVSLNGDKLFFTISIQDI